MIRLLALASLLVLLPLPLPSLAAQAAQAPVGENSGSGMAAKPHFVIEAGVRLPAATPASEAARLALPVHHEVAPSSAAGAPAPGPLPGEATPSQRLLLMGRLQLDGG